MLNRLQQLREMLREQPNDTFLRFAEAQELRKQGELLLCAEKFQSLRELDPDYVGLYFHLAHVLDELGEFGKTEEVFRAGIETAIRVKDNHALAELRNAYINWQLEH